MPKHPRGRRRLHALFEGLSGSKLNRRLLCVARAKRLSVLTDDSIRPLSTRATALWEVCNVLQLLFLDRVADSRRRQAGFAIGFLLLLAGTASIALARRSMICTGVAEDSTVPAFVSTLERKVCLRV